MAAWYCPRCGLRLARVNLPGGDDSCMEANCSSCKMGFTVCVDGCVVRDDRLEREREITRLRNLVVELGGAP